MPVMLVGGGVAPTVNLALRAGLAERVDFGVQIGGLGIMTDVNYAFVLDESYAVSINPSVSATYSIDSFFGRQYWVTRGELALLFDVGKTETDTLMFGVKPGIEFQGTKDSLHVTGLAGLKARVSPNFALMPVLEVEVPLDDERILVRASLGLLF